MRTSACVQCGFCCSQRPCAWGDWDNDRRCCSLLTDPNDQGARFCKIYRSIVRQEAGSKYPMMGCGCSSTLFNDIREARITKMEENK
jgi:hypothetical protein